MKRVLFFGSFDPLHTGHRHAFAEARSLGDYLSVVVARDSTIAEGKSHASHEKETSRLGAVAADVHVDEAILGEQDPASYTLLSSIPFDVLALGYDQQPSDEAATSLLNKLGLSHVSITRLSPYKVERYKSSLLRSSP